MRTKLAQVATQHRATILQERAEVRLSLIQAGTLDAFLGFAAACWSWSGLVEEAAGSACFTSLVEFEPV